MTVAQQLRGEQHMTTEGKVGDALKSAPLVLLGAGISREAKGNTPDALLHDISVLATTAFKLDVDLQKGLILSIGHGLSESSLDSTADGRTL